MLMEDKIFNFAFSVVEKEKKVWISCSNLCGFMFDPKFQPLFTDLFSSSIHHLLNLILHQKRPFSLMKNTPPLHQISSQGRRMR